MLPTLNDEDQHSLQNARDAFIRRHGHRITRWEYGSAIGTAALCAHCKKIITSFLSWRENTYRVGYSGEQPASLLVDSKMSNDFICDKMRTML